MDIARRYFRAIETPSGWNCHIGLARLDQHDDLDAAVEHLSQLGEEHAPSEIWAHYLDGPVLSVATFD